MKKKQVALYVFDIESDPKGGPDYLTRHMCSTMSSFKSAKKIKAAYIEWLIGKGFVIKGISNWFAKDTTKLVHPDGTNRFVFIFQEEPKGPDDIHPS